MPTMSPLLSEMIQALLSRPPGSGYGTLGAILHRKVPFDRLTLCAAEPGGAGLRVLHALASEDGNSEVVGRGVPIEASLAGQVYREQGWRHVDLAIDPGAPPLEDIRRARLAGMKSGLAFPLTVAGFPVGVCLLWSQQPDRFNKKHEAFLLALQPALSISLRNDLIFVEAERRSLELRALERLARSTRKSLDLEEVIPACLDAALALLGLSTGGILLLRDDRLEMVLHRNMQIKGPLFVPIKPALHPDSPLRRSFAERRPLVCEDISADPQLSRLLGVSSALDPSAGPVRRTWLLTIPLFAGEIDRGVVFACGYDTFPLTPAEVERMATIGHWIGSAIADAERHADARQMASANVFYRHIITHLRDAVIATDATGKIAEWTGGAEALTGWRSADVKGQDLLSLLYGSRAPEMRRTIEDEFSKRGLYRGESTILRKSGPPALWESVVAPIELPYGRPGGHGWVGVHRDVGESRQRAEHQHKQQQLESLSSLAGGLAHDFNNTLGAVLLTSLLVREAALKGDPDRTGPTQLLHDMDVIIDAARRGASLAGQLLAFSRGAPLHLVPLNLSEVILQAIHQFTGRDRLRPSSLQITTRFSDPTPPVRGDREQLVRALLNLFQNAEEAMPLCGRLYIATQEADRVAGPPGDAAMAGDLPAGRYVRILLHDEGPGIAPAVRARLFEPFVTTKKSAAGLGLAVVFGVVKAHGGSISFDTDRDRGTTFLIDLPLALVPTPAPTASGHPSHGPAAARILVVDDEPVLTRIAARILRSNGYSVDTVGAGIDALARYARAGAYDLVVLDSTMPGMSGREVLDELLRRDPAVRVLVVSGYSMDGGPADLLQEGARGFLPKPFTPQELLGAIKDILDE